jgi:hypothetical protein
MKYAYEDLSTGQFESLIVAVCQFLLGAAVQGFAEGPDGGRDAKFVGTAELIPSKADPWKGIVIIQAKHTNGFNQSFSDASFFSDKSNNTVLGKELPRIEKLRQTRALDHYMLFSNRKLTGNGESKIRADISTKCDLPEPSICLCGTQQLEMWMKRFPQAAEIAEIDPIDSPLIVSPDDLAEVVEGLAKYLKNAGAMLFEPPIDRVSYERKNQLNKMTAEYARELRNRYLKDTREIQTFLAAPENDELLRKYEAATQDFQLSIIAKRQDYQSFDEVMLYLRSLLFGRDPFLKAHKRLTDATLFYMYWNCDIGLRDDAQT